MQEPKPVGAQRRPLPEKFCSAVSRGQAGKRREVTGGANLLLSDSTNSALREAHKLPEQLRMR